MTGEIVHGVFIPLDDSWVVLTTNHGVYTLRLGGYRKESDPLELDNYEVISCPYIGQQVQAVYSDDFWMYILLDNGGVISHGHASINYLGETSLGILYDNILDYEKGFFESDEVFKIITSPDGRSVADS